MGAALSEVQESTERKKKVFWSGLLAAAKTLDESSCDLFGQKYWHDLCLLVTQTASEVAWKSNLGFNIQHLGFF